MYPLLGGHKTIGVKRFHRVLNHSFRIFAEERGTLECGIVTVYAWNAIPIDETDIIRSVPYIGCELKFLIEINTGKLPSVIDSFSESIGVYLHYIQNDVEFLRQLLVWLLDDRHTIRRERTNEKQHLVVYKPGDIYMAHIIVYRNKKKSIVGKLVYQTRGPYIILETTSLGVYNCRKYGKPNGATKKL